MKPLILVVAVIAAAPVLAQTVPLPPTPPLPGAQATPVTPAIAPMTAPPDTPRSARDELREARRQAREAERVAHEAERRADEAERRLAREHDDDDTDEASDDNGYKQARHSPTLRIGKANQRVTFGNDVHVDDGQEVESAVAMGGSVYVGAHAVVHDDVVSMGGDIVIGDGAVVEGDVVSMGGNVDVAPTAIIRGNRVNLGPGVAGMGKTFHLGSSLPWKILGAVARGVRILVLFALATLIVFLMPRRLSVMRTFLSQRFAVSALAGLAALAAIVPLCILLVITLIGIPLAPLAVVGFLLTLVLGFAVVAIAIGERLPVMANKKTMFFSMVLGFAVLTVIDMFLPIVGGILVFGAALVGAGAVLLSRFGQTRETPAAPATPPSSTALTTL